MSIGTKSKDCDGPLYPQWGEAHRVNIDEVDWSGLDWSDIDPCADDGEADRDWAAVADVGEETRREDGAAEEWGPDTGATTAEYAITTLAACGFAALLVVILKSEPIKELVTGVIETALGLGV